MLINTKGSILESLLLFRGLEFGNETFHLDHGINLSRCGIERAGCYGELWLRPLSQDLFSARVSTPTQDRCIIKQGNGEVQEQLKVRLIEKNFYRWFLKR